MRSWVTLVSSVLTAKSRSTREVGMRIGSLVKGKVNRCIGVVTTVDNDLAKVYWVAMQLQSTIWCRKDELEIICK